MKGVDGVEKIQKIMSDLRDNPPKAFGDVRVLRIRDYKKNEIKDLETGKVTETGLPSSNVLYYDLEDDGWCCARPSGTEPKIKFYMGVKGTDMEDADRKLNVLTDNLLTLIKE